MYEAYFGPVRGEDLALQQYHSSTVSIHVVRLGTRARVQGIVEPLLSANTLALQQYHSSTVSIHVVRLGTRARVQGIVEPLLSANTLALEPIGEGGLLHGSSNPSRRLQTNAKLITCFCTLHLAKKDQATRLFFCYIPNNYGIVVGDW